MNEPVNDSTGLFLDKLQRLPLIAILRGLTLDRAVAAGSTLSEAGFQLVEVPLNSPDPLKSIETLALGFTSKLLVGAGTVLHPADVTRVADAGGRLIVAPNFNPAVVAEAKRLGLVCVPGVATPSEGFAALDAGADALKLFPGDMLTPPVVKAWRAVFPPDAILLPVGGVDLDNLTAYWHAGASGFGLGSALFKPDQPDETLALNAERFAGLLWELLEDAE